MLSGPAILRASVLLLIAGGLAALVQYWLPSSPAVPPTEDPRPATGEPNPPPVRRILPAPEAARPTPPPAAAAPPQVPSQASAPGRPVAPPSPMTMDATPLRLPSDAMAVPSSSPAAAARGEAEVAEARATEGPAAIALVDLNSATVADLNRLRGGGNIGRAIVAKRPYAAVSDLLTKRVLSRTTFERIREQVTVR